jgi:hypothetical protein
MSTISHPSQNELTSLPGLLIGLILDYFRWLALVPMVFAWAFLVLAVILILAINFQGGIDRMLERAEPTVERWLGPDGYDSEAISLTEEDFKPWVYRIWLAVALVGYLLDLVRGWLFGPRQLPSLKRKLLRAAKFAAACSVLLFVAWLFGSERWAGSAAGWIAAFIFGPFVVWMISAGCLSISHAINTIQPGVIRFSDRIIQPGRNLPETQRPPL